MTFEQGIAVGAVGIIAIEFIAVMWIAHKAPIFDEKDRWGR